jgi:hypothetical protein
MAEPETTQNVVVAVKIRPLVAAEVEQGCRASLSVIPGAQPQVTLTAAETIGRQPEAGEDRASASQFGGFNSPRS